MLLEQQKNKDSEGHQKTALEKERASFKADQLLIDTSEIKKQLSAKIEEAAEDNAASLTKKIQEIERGKTNVFLLSLRPKRPSKRCCEMRLID